MNTSNFVMSFVGVLALYLDEYEVAEICDFLVQKSDLSNMRQKV